MNDSTPPDVIIPKRPISSEILNRVRSVEGLAKILNRKQSISVGPNVTSPIPGELSRIINLIDIDRERDLRVSNYSKRRNLATSKQQKSRQVDIPDRYSADIRPIKHILNKADAAIVGENYMLPSNIKEKIYNDTCRRSLIVLTEQWSLAQRGILTEVSDETLDMWQSALSTTGMILSVIPTPVTQGLAVATGLAAAGIAGYRWYQADTLGSKEGNLGLQFGGELVGALLPQTKILKKLPGAITAMTGGKAGFMSDVAAPVIDAIGTKAQQYFGVDDVIKASTKLKKPGIAWVRPSGAAVKDEAISKLPGRDEFIAQATEYASTHTNMVGGITRGIIDPTLLAKAERAVLAFEKRGIDKMVAADPKFGRRIGAIEFGPIERVIHGVGRGVKKLATGIVIKTNKRKTGGLIGIKPTLHATQALAKSYGSDNNPLNLAPSQDPWLTEVVPGTGSRKIDVRRRMAPSSSFAPSR